MKGLIYLILFAAVLAGGWYAYKYWQESQTDTSVEVVKTAPAIKRDISDILEETGTINPVNKMFDEIAPKYVGRTGGYTKIIRIGARRGDGSEMAILEFV